MSTFINDEFKMNCVFTTQEGKEIVITGVDEGIVKVDFSFENTPELAARLLVGCFDKVSNFEKVVGKAYNQGQEGWMKGIEINVFDKKLTVTRENASAFNISEFLRKYTDEFWKGFMEKLHNELKNRRKNIEDIIEANESEEIVFESIASKNMWMSWMAWEIEQEGKKGEKTVAVAITFAKYAQFNP